MRTNPVQAQAGEAQPTGNPLPARHIDRREIGPVGTVTRLIGGALGVGLPILGGAGRWDFVAGLVALPIVATIAWALVRAGYRKFAHRPLASSWGPVFWFALAVAVVLIPAMVLTPVTDYALWIWIGASLLLGAAFGYGGCEVLAFPNLFSGRRDQVLCCVYSPIDEAERRRSRSRVSRSAQGPAA